MSFLKKKPFLTVGALILLIIGIPAAIYLSQRQTDDRGRAAQSSKLSFTPSSNSSTPINVATGNSVTLDVILDPGNNQVSYLQTEIAYDPAKFQVIEGGFQVNIQAFPTIIQGPNYSSGRISFAISVGADGTKAVQSPTKVGTLTLKAQSSGSSQISFASNSQALSIDPNSTPRENVISGTTPAYLLISNTQTTTGPTPPPAACADSPSNTMLVIDKSGSMSVASVANKITQAKIAAKNYVDIISKDSQNLIGLISYENTATVNSPLTTNYTSVKNQIDSLVAIGSTCTECAILAANRELAKSTNSNKKVAIILTDGKANFIEGNANQVDTSLAEQKAITAATAGANSGIVFYTIGLGQEINSTFLQQIASTSGGKYFASPSPNDLTSIYNQISQISGKGSVTGIVFNDANNNSVFDANEEKLSGWTLQLLKQGTSTPQNFISDSNGFNITSLCNGTYTLKEVVQSGWIQTLPKNPNEYTINIVNGNAITDRNFGNKREGNTCSDGRDNNNNNLIDTNDPACHTDGDPNNPQTYDPNLPENGNTCADKIDNNGNDLIDAKDPICHTDGNPNNPKSYDPKLPETGGRGTKLSLTVFQHGIGNSGDNVNQNLHSLSNKNPLTKTIPVDTYIYNVSNQLVASVSGQLVYNNANGNYTGTVTTPNPLSQGAYNIRVGTKHHLIRRLPGIQNILTNATNNLPPIHLVTGDIINDNQLNILDYNVLIDCYSDDFPAPNCKNQTKKSSADINDDGLVNQVDYNLFLREIANQPGD